MTTQREGWIDDRPYATVDAGLACLDCGGAYPSVEAFVDHDCDDPSEPAVRPANDPEALPPGYELEGGKGGYYTLKDPDGEVIEGPSNGKHQGEDGAADAAWIDYDRRIEEA